MEKLVGLETRTVLDGALSAIDAAEAHHPIWVSPSIASVTSSPCSPMKTVLPREMVLIAPLTGPIKKQSIKRNIIRKRGTAIAIINLSFFDYLKFSSGKI